MSSKKNGMKKANTRRRLNQILALVLSGLMCVGAFTYVIMAILGLF